jgi:class 3 adenylate cyclase
MATPLRLSRRLLVRPTTPDGTVTVLFSDIENSTLMNLRLGDQRWLDVVRSHNALIRHQVRLHRGYEVKSQGDGFMVAFASALRAIRCAIGIQRTFSTFSDGHLSEPLRVRIGLHTGEAIKENGDFYGRSVILASRIAEQARGGEILVSSLVKSLTESASDLEFDHDREVPLKGLDGMQRLYRVPWDAAPGVFGTDPATGLLSRRLLWRPTR